MTKTKHTIFQFYKHRTAHLQDHGLHKEFQRGFGVHYSSETALVKVITEITRTLSHNDPEKLVQSNHSLKTFQFVQELVGLLSRPLYQESFPVQNGRQALQPSDSSPVKPASSLENGQRHSAFIAKLETYHFERAYV